MELRSLRHRTGMRPVDGYYAVAVIPLGESDDRLVQSLLAPLQRALLGAGMGRIARFDLTSDPGRGERMVIELSLVSDAPATLRRLAAILEELNAPRGSTLGLAECPEMIRFGRVSPETAPGRDDARAASRTAATLSARLRGREPLLEEAVYRVIAAAAECRSARDGRLN